MADTARGERAQADRVARSAVLTRGEPVTWGRHLRQCGVRPGALGQRARRHYWLAPRSDDAVGAEFGWGRALAGLQQLDFGCRRFRPAGRTGGAFGPRARLLCRLGQGGRLSCPMSDKYLQAFRLPGFRR